jgi:exopolyphosphatase/guanosine-5'-triphosphate,3'-diphosphate pyrophosphatase
MAEANGNGAGPVAAVDLGSNSFHLVVGREVDGRLVLVDRLRDPVRMAGGLDEQGRLAPDVLKKVCAALERFGQLLRGIPEERVRAIGTNAFRQAQDPPDLLERASAALGFPIEVVSGHEEARLIYLGVAHDQPKADGRRLVIDIGGGSTECILGQDFSPQLLDCLSMGCVTWSQRFFRSGELTRKAFRKAEVAAKIELETIQKRYRDRGWKVCLGAAGTINATAAILRQAGWSDGTITLHGVKHLRKRLMELERVERIELAGLAPDRAPVIAGGVAILKALLETFEIESMTSSEAALREGVLYDLLGRIHKEDVRDRTIRSLASRFSVDEEQAERVERTALRSLAQVAEDWRLDSKKDGQFLAWAARVHEIGLALAYDNHHKHGGYLLANASMPGFTRQEQLRLAALVTGHRRKLARALFDELPHAWREPTLRLCLLLRVAVRLNRSRSPDRLPPFELRARENGLAIEISRKWLEDHPLTLADLEDEDAVLSEAGFRLHVS